MPHFLFTLSLALAAARAQEPLLPLNQQSARPPSLAPAKPTDSGMPLLEEEQAPPVLPEDIPSSAVGPITRTKEKLPTLNEKPEELTLATAIAKANRNNPTLYARRLTQELNEIGFDNAYARMWLPRIALNIGANSPYTVGRLNTLNQRNTGGPDTSASLSLGEYTIYNFGKDQDAYQIAKLEVERSRQNVKEVERAVRFETVNAVFRFKTQQDLLDIAQRSVDASRSIFELVKSRVGLGKATNAEAASIEVDFLKAKNALINAQVAYQRALWDLNYVLGDPIDHPYRVRSGIRHIKFKMALEDVLAVFKENAPAIRQARKDLEQARLAQRLAEKNALPLPAITFSGVTVGYGFGPTGTRQIRDTTSTINGNVDVSAQVNFSIPLMGDGGFLNGRNLRAAELATELSELSFRNAANGGETQVRTLYTQVLHIESTIENNERLYKDSLRVFEHTLQNLQSRQILNRLDVKDAIAQLRDSEQQFTQSVLDHYKLKLDLANAIGVDRYPEENL